MRNVVMTAALALAAAAPAQAQVVRWEDRGYVNFSVGFQAPSRDLSVNNSFTLYTEESTIEGTREVGTGAVIDFSGGMRVWDNLAIGIGYSRFADSGSMVATVAVPDPLIRGNPQVQTINVDDLDHSENAVHFSAVWFWPMTDKIDIALSAGPSIFTVSQDVVTINESNVLPDTSTLTGVTRNDDSKTTIGFNIGVDASYMVTRRYGAGVMLRYAGASTDLAGTDVDMGGLHFGVGVRVRF